jgi:head-tail adaptor
MPHPYPHPWARTSDPLALPPGLLRHAIEVQRPSDTPGLSGASVNPADWIRVLVCMAGIDLISARDNYASEQLSSQLSHVVWMRWTDTPVRAGYRIKVQSAPTMPTRYFMIQAVENVQERNRILTLRCLEVDAGQ